jgi:hypothetical protein
MAAMLDFDRLRALARGEIPSVPASPSTSPVAPVAPVAAKARTSATGFATGVSHCIYSVTGATGEIYRYASNRDRKLVALPVATCSAAAKTSEFEVDRAEREAVAIELGGVPEIYASAFAQIQANAPPEVPLERWHQFINDAGIFLDQWGREAERQGWKAEELFGLHPDVPMARYDRMGLIWVLKGERVVALTTTGARLSSGLTFYRKGL